MTQWVFLQVVSLLVQYTGPDSGRRGRGGEREEDEDEEDCNCNTNTSKSSTVRPLYPQYQNENYLDF